MNKPELTVETIRLLGANRDVLQAILETCNNVSVLVNDNSEFCITDANNGEIVYNSQSIGLYSAVSQQLNNAPRVRSARLNCWELSDASDPLDYVNLLKASADRHGPIWLSSLATAIKSCNAQASHIGLSRDVLVLGAFAFYCIIQQVRDGNLSHYTSITLAESDPMRLMVLFYLFPLEDILAIARKRKFIFNLAYDTDRTNIQERLFSIYTSTIPLAIHGLSVVSEPKCSPILELTRSWIFSDSGIGYRYLGSLGTSSDEFNQLIQAAWNLRNNSLYLTANIFSDFNCPALVVASGPSLDLNIHHVKSNREYFLLIAAGSSLGTLLRSGITPDIVVLLERGSETYSAVQELVDEGYTDQLSQIIPIIANSCDPRLLSIFKNSILFSRPSSAANIFDPSWSEYALPIAGPESANAAFEAAFVLGIRKIYTVGMDFGSSNPKIPRSALAIGKSPRSLDEPVSGNLGRTIYTQPSLISAAQSVNNLLQAFPSINLTRIGEGVKISHSSIDYTSFSDLEINWDPLNKPEIFSTLNALSRVQHTQLPVYAATILTQYTAELSLYLDEFISCLESVSTWDSSSLQSLSQMLIVHESSPIYRQSSVKLMRHVLFYFTSLFYDSLLPDESYCVLQMLREFKQSVLSIINASALYISLHKGEWSPQLIATYLSAV